MEIANAESIFEEAVVPDVGIMRSTKPTHHQVCDQPLCIGNYLNRMKNIWE